MSILKILNFVENNKMTLISIKIFHIYELKNNIKMTVLPIVA
jgi:hypothetical protein